MAYQGKKQIPHRCIQWNWSFLGVLNPYEGSTRSTARTWSCTGSFRLNRIMDRSIRFNRIMRRLYVSVGLKTIEFNMSIVLKTTRARQWGVAQAATRASNSPQLANLSSQIVFPKNTFFGHCNHWLQQVRANCISLLLFTVWSTEVQVWKFYSNRPIVYLNLLILIKQVIIGR